MRVHMQGKSHSEKRDFVLVRIVHPRKVHFQAMMFVQYHWFLSLREPNQLNGT